MITTKTTFANAAVGNSAQVLQAIHEQTKNIAIYQRENSPPAATLEHVVAQSIECRASGTIEEVTERLNIYFTDHLPEQKALLEDVLEQLALFGRLANTTSFRLLLVARCGCLSIVSACC